MKYRSFIDPFLGISIILYAFLYIPFLGSIPYLDGNIDFVKSYDFFTGGFTRLFQEWISVHPPLKEFIMTPLFFLFGVNRYIYTLPWFFLGIMGIISLFSFTQSISNLKTARIAALFLATSPLFISVGIFGLTDFLLAIFITAAINQYVKGKYLRYSFFASLAILAKETAAVFCLSVIFVELMNIFRIVKKGKQIKKYLCSLGLIIFPLLLLFIWILFLKISGKSLWSDWNFSETASRGSLYTIFNNLFQLKLFNEYAYQNWLHLFILNFNWFWWSIIFGSAIIMLVKKRAVFVPTLIALSQKTKAVLIIIVFIFSYLITALSFQTYPITRYILPLIPLVIVFVSISIFVCLQTFPKSKLIIFPLVSFIITLSLFFSADPLSHRLWEKTFIQKTPFYALHQNLAGNDGLTYNMQYLLLSKMRTKKIMEASSYSKPVISQECQWIFPDPNNDKKTIQILDLAIPLNKWCTDNQESLY